MFINFLTIGLVAPCNGAVVAMGIVAAVSASSAIDLLIVLQYSSGAFSVVAVNNLKTVHQILDGL